MPTELRVHGVSGARAENVLDRPLIKRVAGNDEAGFFRPRPAYGDATGPAGAELEAYRWGNLTAGTASRALWLLLLPFMLGNVAMWLRPAGRRGTVSRALCRIFALTITATFVLSMVGVSLDLVAWQCAPYARCAADRPYLNWLTAGFFAPTGRRLAVLSVVPIAAIALLWWLGSRTWRSYEAFRPEPADSGGDGLDSARCWDGMALVGRLRSIHVAAAFGTVDAVLIGVLARHERDAFGYALAAATAALLAACVAALGVPAVVDRDSRARWVEAWSRGLRIAALVLTAIILGYAFAPRAEWSAAGTLPGYAGTLTVVFAAQTALLLILGATVLVERRARPDVPAFLAGLGAPILASVAVGLAVAMSAGLAYRVADFLDRNDVPSPANVGPVTAVAPLQPPVAYEWSSLGFLLAAVTAVLLALVARRWILPGMRATAREVTDADFPTAPADAAGRLGDVRATVAAARMTERVESLIAVGYAPLAVVSLVFTGYALVGTSPVALAARWFGDGSRAEGLVSVATNLGTYLIGGFAIGLIVLGLLAYRYAGIRRVVGVLWDLGTFWPRAAHPLAPPCYAERVVPELVKRVRCLAGRDGVVVSGHSQGSVLAAATVLQLPPETLDRVALLTYGSPLRRLYARLFPAYVNDDVLRAVHDRVGGRWLNLWRDTDPIGGWVFSAHRSGRPARVAGPLGDVDWRLRDPRGVAVEPCDTVPPPIEGHSAYQSGAVFDVAVGDLLARLGTAPPSGTGTAEPDAATAPMAPPGG